MSLTNARIGHYIGIDPSLTRTGIAVITQTPIGITRETYSLSVARTAGHTPRLYQFRKQLQNILNVLHPQNTLLGICIEEASYCSLSRQVDLAELRGVFKVTCMEYGCEPHGIAPTRLKKFGAGQGDASKDMMVKAAGEAGWDVRNDDEADAAHLAQIAYALRNFKTMTLTREQLEVIRDMGVTL